MYVICTAFKPKLPIGTVFSIVACHGNKADIMFLLDSSASEGASNFQHQLEFVQNFTDKFDIGPDAVPFSYTHLTLPTICSV